MSPQSKLHELLPARMNDLTSTKWGSFPMIADLNHRWLVLWDIDHTLLETRGMGSELYARASKTATGIEMKQPADVIGQTEPSIFVATLRLHGIPETEQYLVRYKQALAKEYADHQPELHRRGRALPGARDALAALASEPAVIQSVLSGNLRAVAQTKLSVFALNQHLDVEIGAYGTTTPTDRSSLRLLKNAHNASTAHHSPWRTPWS